MYSTVDCQKLKSVDSFILGNYAFKIMCDAHALHIAFILSFLILTYQLSHHPLFFQWMYRGMMLVRKVSWTLHPISLEYMT